MVDMSFNRIFLGVYLTLWHYYRNRELGDIYFQYILGNSFCMFLRVYKLRCFKIEWESRRI